MFPVTSIKLVGILNVTPDSFSDGGNFTSPDKAIQHAKEMCDQGADYIDIGGDSTRPGSSCVGVEEEWRRIKDIIGAVSKFSKVSVDTHYAETARRAIEEGAKIVNDVSAGFDKEMFSVVAKSNVSYVMMYSRWSVPHVFDTADQDPIVDKVNIFLKDKISLALEAGVRPEQIIVDPAMGGFLSETASDSIDVLNSVAQILPQYPQYPLFLGISRKGFLRQWVSTNEEKDWISAILAFSSLSAIPMNREVFLRVHNVWVHKIGQILYDSK